MTVLEGLDTQIHRCDDSGLRLSKRQQRVNDVGHVRVLRVGMPLDSKRLHLIRRRKQPAVRGVGEIRVVEFHAQNGNPERAPE